MHQAISKIIVMAFWFCAGALPLNAEQPQSQKDRQAEWGKYFSPRPGSETRFDPHEVADFGARDPFKLRGYIEVNPPAGNCFRIERREDLPDEKVCSKKVLSWNAHDILPGGVIRWNIRFSAKDPGGEFEWFTPHRIGQVIPPGERLPELYKPLLLLDCKVEIGTRSRKIHIPLANGRTWSIQFPVRDTLAPQPKPEANLYFQEKTGLAGISDDSSTDMDRKYSFDATKARANARKNEDVTTYWVIPERDAFEMNSSNFLSSDSPSGSVGKCRYRLAQQLDQEKGFIECHHTSEFDVIYLPLPCLPDLLSSSKN